MNISVRQLKSHLSEYLRKAAAGEEVVVTSHGREVARLMPPRSVHPDTMSDADLVARFRGLPWVRHGRDEKPALPEPLLRIGAGEKTLAELVSEGRG